MKLPDIIRQLFFIFVMLTLLEKYLIIVIVVWRLTHLICAEDGPFDLIIKLRKSLGNSFFGKLMDCFYCVSIWIGLAAACFAGDNLKEIIILTLYYSGTTLLLEKITNKNFV
jgi:hypothetical protein